MKADLDRLMTERGLDAIIVAGGEQESAPRNYLSNGAHITGGLIIKKVGSPAVMIVSPMETEEAAKSGLKVYSTYDMGWAEIYQQADYDLTKATVAYWENCLRSLDIPAGRIGIYGVGDINMYIELVRLLEQAHPQYEFVGETSGSGYTLFEEAYITKDADELARLKAAGQRTSEVLQATWDYIASHRAAGDTVVKADGTALTIGDVKAFVRNALQERGMEDNQGMIFAQGRDAAFPHSRGEDAMPLKLGQSIVFDLFPREIGAGYFHDVTRTWCIGYAPEKVQRAYETVAEAFDIAIETFAANKPAHLMQEAVLDHFERKGHPTIRSAPRTTTGYVHGLGHGIGLNVHEWPRISHTSKKDIFQVGNVFTVEPGLYYPEEGYGVRLEDSVYVSESGELIPLTTFHKDLVLPLRG